MPTFLTISPVREEINQYRKHNSYNRCCIDLCDFFKDKTIEEIYNNRYILSEGKNCRYIKSRIDNSNNGKGKSSGYRVYYYVDFEKATITIIGFYPKVGKYGMSDIGKSQEKARIDKFREERGSGILVAHNIKQDFSVLEPA